MQMKNLQEPLCGSFKAGDSTHSHFLCLACTPTCSEIWRQYSMLFWHATRMQQYNVLLCPFVELNVVHSQASQFPSWAEPCSYMPFLCSCFHKIAIMQAVLQLDWWIRLIHSWLGCCTHNPILPWSWLQALQPWVPYLTYACEVIHWYSHHHHANEKGKWLLGVENTWGARTSRVIAVTFKWHTPLGSHE